MEEDKIDSFFREMRKADEQLVISPFPKRKGTRRLLPSFLYAAAATVTILVIGAYLVWKGGHQPVQPGEVIILVQEDALKTHSLIDAREESLSDWKSPTGYLSEDF
jgi:hypothetical protein